MLDLYDVIVVGGGPAGSQVAYRLAGKGHRVVVLEQKAVVGEGVCCTGIVGCECLAAFGIDGGLVLRKINRARLFSPSGKQLSLARAETQAVVLERGAFDRAMAARARSSGAEYCPGSPVGDVEVLKDRVRVSLTPPARGSVFEARAVVIAAGFPHRLTRRLGLGSFGDAVFGAQAEVPADGVDEVEVYFGREIAPGFFGWLVPSAPGKARVGLLARRRIGHYFKQFVARLAAQGKIASGDTEPDFGGIPLKPLERTSASRLLVVGEAAGQVKPTSGGGIYYGLLGADIATEVLHPALELDRLSGKDLARYDRRWRRRLGREIALGYWARKVFEHLSDGQVDRIFDIISNTGLDRDLLDMKEMSFDWHGKVILALLRQRAFSGVSRLFGRPLPGAGRSGRGNSL
ncbi:MAG: NAD(P)/FAD-dependent oxidoreductase [Chloroflexota bacterium]